MDPEWPNDRVTDSIEASATEKFRKVVEAYEAIAGHVAEIPAVAALLGPHYVTMSWFEKCLGNA